MWTIGKLREPAGTVLICECFPICAHLEHPPCLVFLRGHIHEYPCTLGLCSCLSDPFVSLEALRSIHTFILIPLCVQLDQRILYEFLECLFESFRAVFLPKNWYDLSCGLKPAIKLLILFLALRWIPDFDEKRHLFKILLTLSKKGSTAFVRVSLGGHGWSVSMRCTLLFLLRSKVPVPTLNCPRVRRIFWWRGQILGPIRKVSSKSFPFFWWILIKNIIICLGIIH